MGLETVEIVMDLEAHFGIALPDQIASPCMTVADLQRAIVNLLVQRGQPRTPQLEADVLADIVKIAAAVTGNDPTTIRPESRWIGDVTKHG